MRWIFVICALLCGSVALAQETSGGRLTVTGEGRVDSAPDMATITLGVTAEARTAAKALEQTSAATAEVLALLSGAGVEPRDVQTRDLSLSPQWSNYSSSTGERARIVGYQASNTVVVRVRALDDLGEILDDVVESGANQFHGLSFGLQDPGPVQDAARRAAVAEALRKAALYAQAAGLRLGQVLEFNESGSASPRPVMLERMAMAPDAVPVAQGEVTTQAMVTMVFAIDGP